MAEAIGKASNTEFLNQALQTPVVDKGLTPVNQPTLDDYIAEAQKLGQQSVQNQQAILRQDTEQVGQDLSRQLYGQNIGTSGISEKVIGKAISDQQKRLEPYAMQAGTEAAQTALKQRYEMTNKAIDLAVSGNLTGQGAQQIVTAAFGQGTTLTNKDQQDLENAARASGLNPNELMVMKRAIGTAQWDDIMANPQDYVESPAKMQAFQMELAKLQVDAMKESASMQADASKYASDKGAEGAMWQGLGAAAGAALMFSDKKLKKRKSKIVNPIELIKKIKPIRFLWNKTNKVDFGVVAQDIEKVAPDLVTLDKVSGYKMVNYNGLFAILLAAFIEHINEGRK
jgi:energy-converting hydrogenase Eha subunit A